MSMLIARSHLKKIINVQCCRKQDHAAVVNYSYIFKFCNYCAI